MFDWVNALRHSHQYCSHVGTKKMPLGGLNVLFYGNTRRRCFAKPRSPVLELNAITTAPACFLSYLLDDIYIRFGTKLYRQIVGIPMGRNCAPLVADLFLYCYERDFMDSLNHHRIIKLMLSRLLIRLLGTSITF